MFAIFFAITFLTGNILVATLTINGHIFDAISEIIKIEPDAIILVTIVSMIIAPMALIYLIIDGFNRGLSKNYSLIFTVVSLIPVCVCTTLFHIVFAMITRV